MSEQEFDVRPMTEADAAAVCEIGRLSLKGESWSQESVLTELKYGQARCFAALCCGSICGFVMLRTVLDEGDIVSLAVHPAFRRRGAASALLRQVDLLAAEEGLSFVSLEVREGNAAARALYGRAGYREEAHRPRFYRNPTEDAVVMMKYYA